MVIGVGGEPQNPKELYIIPLGQLTGNVIMKEVLINFRKTTINDGFFWDVEKKELK